MSVKFEVQKAFCFLFYKKSQYCSFKVRIIVKIWVYSALNRGDTVSIIIYEPPQICKKNRKVINFQAQIRPQAKLLRHTRFRHPCPNQNLYATLKFFQKVIATPFSPKNGGWRKKKTNALTPWISKNSGFCVTIIKTIKCLITEFSEILW